MPFRKLLHFPAGVCIVILPCSCGPSYVAPPVTGKIAQSSRSPASELQRGHDIHQAKCAKCHAFENPAECSATELRREIMPVMARKAKLNEADAQAVTAYLLAVRGSQSQP